MRPLSVIILALLLAARCLAVDPVEAELGKESAWTGEAVPLVLTLYSPGPFSGTASFDLPRLPQTVVIPSGTPVVGSTTVDGDTYFTQRHVLTIYTQRSGEIEIPAFEVRFAGKKTFTSDPEPINGTTKPLKFQSNRPPGTDELGVVIAVDKMDVTQTWTPDAVSSLKAGDVIERTVTRMASGTTAMMMPPLTVEELDGVRVYVPDPIVQDKSVRGATTAERRDTIKYQFERAGTFTVPEATIVWWDAPAGELRSQTLPGQTVDVVAAAITAPDVVESAAGGSKITRMLAVTIALLLVGALVWRVIQLVQSRPEDPESQAARAVVSACRSNRPSDAYAALLHWKRIVLTDAGDLLGESDDLNALRSALDDLSEMLYHDGDVQSWDGESLASIFKQSRRAFFRAHQRRKATSRSLPSLNP